MKHLFAAKIIVVEAAVQLDIPTSPHEVHLPADIKNPGEQVNETVALHVAVPF